MTSEHDHIESDLGRAFPFAREPYTLAAVFGRCLSSKAKICVRCASVMSTCPLIPNSARSWFGKVPPRLQ